MVACIVTFGKIMNLRHLFTKLDQLKWYDWVFGWFVFLWVTYFISWIVGYWILPFIYHPLIGYIIVYNLNASFIGIPVYIIWKWQNKKKEKKEGKLAEGYK